MPVKGKKKLFQSNNTTNAYLKPPGQKKRNKKFKSERIPIDEYSDPISEYEYSNDDEFLTQIDRQHIGRPEFVPQYAEQIIINLQKQAIDFRIPVQRFCQIQTEINLHMRSVVIKWLINVHNEFELSSETLFSSIYYFDYILSQILIKKRKIQLLGSVCLWVAAKIHEMSPPSVNELIELCNTQYDLADFEKYERFVLNVLNFRLQIPHTKLFLQRYIDALELRPTLCEIANFICEASLFCYELNQYNPSKVAVAIIVITITLMKSYLPFQKLKVYSHLDDYKDVEECISYLIFSAKEVLDSKTGAIYQRYTDTNSTGILLRANFNDDLINKIIRLHLSQK